MKRKRPLLSCRECADFLCDYTCGELPAAQRREFERHLAACPPCVVYLKTYERTVALERPALCGGHGAPATEMPEALVRAILAARATPKTSAKRPRTPKKVKKAPAKAKRGTGKAKRKR